MNLIKFLFGGYDHEDDTDHEWSMWEPIVMDVKRYHHLSNQMIQGKQDAQKRRCKLCGKTEVEDIQ